MSALASAQRQRQIRARLVDRWARRLGLADERTSVAADLSDFIEQGPDPGESDPLRAITASLPAGVCARLAGDGWLLDWARAVLDEALAELALEARRAGHDALFEALAPQLAEGAVTGSLSRLALAPDSQPAALSRALRSLRRRLRQHVDRSLRACANSETAAELLRRRLYQCLIDQEYTA